MELEGRIEAALTRLRNAVPKAKVTRPAPSKRVLQLEEEAGALPPELKAYLRVCNGVTVPEGVFSFGDLLSVEQMLNIDSPGFFAIGDDRSGNYDLVAAHFTINPGAVLFWDHESGELETVASSVSTYLEMWVERALVLSRPMKPSSSMLEALESLFDPKSAQKLMQEHDPAALKLRRSKRFLAQLQRVTVEQIDRTGKAARSFIVDPFSKKLIQLPAPPRKRQKWQSSGS